MQAQSQPVSVAARRHLEVPSVALNEFKANPLFGSYGNRVARTWE